MRSYMAEFILCTERGDAYRTRPRSSRTPLYCIRRLAAVWLAVSRGNTFVNEVSAAISMTPHGGDRWLEPHLFLLCNAMKTVHFMTIAA